MRATFSFVFVLILFSYLLAEHRLDAASRAARRMSPVLVSGNGLACPVQDETLARRKKVASTWLLVSECSQPPI
jgi:hypothetical protein